MYQLIFQALKIIKVLLDVLSDIIRILGTCKFWISVLSRLEIYKQMCCLQQSFSHFHYYPKVSENQIILVKIDIITTKSMV